MRKAAIDLLMIVVGPAADAIAAAGVARTCPFPAFIERQNQRAVGEILADPERVDRAHRFNAKTARAALIGERAVDEAVGEHPLSALERRADGLVDMIGPRRGEQQRFGLRSPAILLAAQQAARGSPRRLRCRPARG